MNIFTNAKAVKTKVLTNIQIDTASNSDIKSLASLLVELNKIECPEIVSKYSIKLIHPLHNMSLAKYFVMRTDGKITTSARAALSSKQSKIL